MRRFLVAAAGALLVGCAQPAAPPPVNYALQLRPEEAARSAQIMAQVREQMRQENGGVPVANPRQEAEKARRDKWRQPAYDACGSSAEIYAAGQGVLFWRSYYDRELSRCMSSWERTGYINSVRFDDY